MLCGVAGFFAADITATATRAATAGWHTATRWLREPRCSRNRISAAT
ncbi:MAG: hypothetical protein WDN04_23150 [Rhodospirillales bacterium]